ncbi:hypothetical protein BGZ73_008094 [Actinomortierella ambigua]|nr:hypothetical protein BGZ73_008094 [Actinomortierella ambigua]
MVKSSSSGAYCFVSGLSAKTQATAAKSKYVLNIRQQPIKAKVCGQKERDRRPVDPPPIVQIKLADPSLDRNKDYLQSPYLFMCCNLVHASEPMGDIVAPAHRVLAGTVVSSLHRLKDVDNSDGGFFVFGDMSVRVEGHFCLRFTLFELIDGEVIQVMSTVSDPLTVYSSKNFPGMSESTFLSRCFSDQGVRIRIRKDHHVKPKRPLSADDVDAAGHAIHSPPLSSHEADMSASDYESIPSKRSKHTSGATSGYAKPPHDRQLSLEPDHRLPRSHDVMAIDQEHGPSRPLRDPQCHDARPGTDHPSWPHYPHYAPREYLPHHGYADYPPPPPPHHDPRYPYPPAAYGSPYYKYPYPSEAHHHEHGGYERDRPPYSWVPPHEANPSSGHPYLYYPHPHHPHSVYSHPYPPPPHHRYPYPPIPEGRPHPSAGYPATSESPVMKERSSSASQHQQQRQHKHSATSAACPSPAEHRQSIASSKHSRTPSMSSQLSEGAFSPPHPYSPPELHHAHRPQKTTSSPMSSDGVTMLPPATVRSSESPSSTSLHGAPASPVSPTSSNESSSSSSSRPHLPSLSQSTSSVSTSSSPADRIQLPPIHELSTRSPKMSYIMEPGQIRDHFQERQAPYYYVNH